LLLLVAGAVDQTVVAVVVHQMLPQAVELAVTGLQRLSLFPLGLVTR